MGKRQGREEGSSCSAISSSAATSAASASASASAASASPSLLSSQWWSVRSLSWSCFCAEAVLLWVMFLICSIPLYFLLSKTVFVERETLDGVGSSSAACILSNWANDFNYHSQGSPSYLIDYVDTDCTLSIDGASVLLNATESQLRPNVSFAALDYPLPSFPASSSNYSLLQFPILANALRIYVNAKLPWNLTMSLDNLVGIYNGSIRWWNDTRLAYNNPELITSSNYQQRILPFHRSDPSGATYVLTSVFADHDPTWNKDYGPGGTTLIPNWPVECPNGIGTADGDGDGDGDESSGSEECGGSIVSNEDMYFQVGTVPFSIGYAIYSSSINQDCCTSKTPNSAPVTVSIINRNGTVISDPDSSLSATVSFWETKKTTQFGSTINLNCEECWPFVGFVTIVTLSSYPYLEGFCTGSAISEFLKYCLVTLPGTPGFSNLQLSALNQTLLKKMESLSCHGGQRFVSRAWVTTLLSLGLLFLIVATYRLVKAYQRRHNNDDNNNNSKDEKKKRMPLLQAAHHHLLERKDLALLEQIGHGASGSVFRGIWREIEVAVKKVNAEDFKKFEREAALLKELRHPNIVLFLDTVEDSPDFYLVMEFCERGSLYSLVHSENASKLISNQLRFKMALGVTQGMLYLHNRRPPILHRDLKMHNLLVDKNYQVKIADFGNSREHVTNSNPLTKCGTLLTMAPEVFLDAPYSEKADIYSYGLVLFELFTGEELFPDLAPWAAIRQVANNGLRPPVGRVKPVDLRILIQDCWGADPSQRPDFKQILTRLRIITANELHIPLPSLSSSSLLFSSSGSQRKDDDSGTESLPFLSTGSSSIQ